MANAMPNVCRAVRPAKTAFHCRELEAKSKIVRGDGKVRRRLRIMREGAQLHEIVRDGYSHHGVLTSRTVFSPVCALITRINRFAAFRCPATVG